MSRALDHLVIPAHDLTALAAFYERLGFQVGRRNRHPWGTENHIVQFDGAFLELIGLGEGFERPASHAGEFSFAGFVSDFLARREGLAMLVMRSADAEADRRAFANTGIGGFSRFDFARTATRPDGRVVDVAFSLAFAASPEMPETGFFVCQQHFPENFWSAAAQVHPNGACGIAGLVFAHEAPDGAARFLATFSGGGAKRTPEGWAVEVEGGVFEVAPRAALARHYGESAIPSDGPPLRLVRFVVDDLGALAHRFEAEGIAYRRVGEALLIEPPTAFGAALSFEAAQR